MQYVSDVDAISEAQQNVIDIMNQQAKNKQIADIDKQIEAIRNGTKYVPSETAASNLWKVGAPTPASMMANTVGLGSKLGQTIGINIQNFNPVLPNVTDGESFANYLKNNFWRDTMQYANA